MIINTSYLTQVLDIYKPDFIISPYAKIIAGWCEQHFKKYNQSPGKQIQDLFSEFENDAYDPDQISLIRDFLVSISTEYEDDQNFNVEYEINKTEKHFRKITNLAYENWAQPEQKK